jgi:hypothetical protein
MVAPTSCFAQVLSLVDRRGFERAVALHEAEKGAKGLTCWDQFVAMSFGQMGAADSLREIHGGLATALGKLRHLGIDEAPARSSLSYANAHRPWQVYETVFYETLDRCQDVAQRRGRTFRFKNPLRSLDASVIDLCLESFDWAKFRRAKGAIKLHLMLDHRGYLPCWALVTDGKTHEVKAAWTLHFEAGTIVAMDRGYNDYRLFARWCDEGVFFVTRLKDNAVYEVVERRDVPSNGNILSDEIVRLTGIGAAEKCPHPLRRIVVWDAEHQREIVLLTNIMHLAARTVAAVYKERWQIELFFKALKQNLKVKTFVGTSENAVKTQIWTALIVILLLKFLQLKSTFGWSLSNLAAMLRFNLLTYRDLWAWLDAPYNTPVAEPGLTQLSFLSRYLGQHSGPPHLAPQPHPA